MKERVLITGTEGFIGKNLVEYFNNNNIETIEWNTPYAIPDATVMDSIDEVIHLGAISSTTETDVDLILDHNYNFSYKLLMQCLEHKVDFQYASSASVYGKKNGFTLDEIKSRQDELYETGGNPILDPMDHDGTHEEGLPDPQNAYAWSKYMFDRLVKDTLRVNIPIHIKGFRYFNVYGPHEEHKGEQASVVSKWIRDNKAEIFEDSKSMFRDFVHVKDICEIHRRMLDLPYSGIYNVGTGICYSFEHLANIMTKYKGFSVYKKEMPENLKAHYQYYTKANPKMLEAALGGDFDWTEIIQFLSDLDMDDPNPLNWQ